MLVWYIVKYVTKKQDTFARTLIEAQMMKHVNKLTDSRSRYFHDELLESVSFVESSDLTVEQKRNIGIRLACTLFNILRVGEQLDVTYCLHYLKDRKEHWSSHEFVNVFVGHVVKKELFGEEINETQLREDPFADKTRKYINDDKYRQYVFRPLHLKQLTFYEFTENYFMKNSKGIKNQVAYMFQDNFDPKNIYRCVKVNDTTKRCVSLVEAQFPSHEGFVPSPYEVLGKKAPRKSVENELLDAENEDEHFDDIEVT
jgi:hypothetical protein